MSCYATIPVIVGHYPCHVKPISKSSEAIIPVMLHPYPCHHGQLSQPCYTTIPAIRGHYSYLSCCITNLIFRGHYPLPSEATIPIMLSHYPSHQRPPSLLCCTTLPVIRDHFPNHVTPLTLSSEVTIPVMLHHYSCHQRPVIRGFVTRGIYPK